MLGRLSSLFGERILGQTLAICQSCLKKKVGAHLPLLKEKRCFHISSLMFSSLWLCHLKSGALCSLCRAPVDQFSASGAAGCFSSCIHGRRGMQTLSWLMDLSARRKELQGKPARTVAWLGTGGEVVNEASSQEVAVLVGNHTPW